MLAVTWFADAAISAAGIVLARLWEGDFDSLESWSTVEYGLFAAIYATRTVAAALATRLASPAARGLGVVAAVCWGLLAAESLAALGELLARESWLPRDAERVLPLVGLGATFVTIGLAVDAARTAGQKAVPLWVSAGLSSVLVLVSLASQYVLAQGGDWSDVDTVSMAATAVDVAGSTLGGIGLLVVSLPRRAAFAPLAPLTR
jgi:hypothetical protein